jgi:putative transposase
MLVQPRRNKNAAKRFFRKLLRGLHYVPRVLITDKLGSYAAAKAEIMPGAVHLRDKGKNNRAENYRGIMHRTFVQWSEIAELGAEVG